MSELQDLKSHERREHYNDLFEETSLQPYEGTFANTSLTSLLFRLSLLRSNATLICEGIPNKPKMKLTLKKGKIVDVIGVPDLLANKIGTTSANSLSEIVEIAMGRGLDFETIYQELSKDLGTYFVLLSNQSYGNIVVGEFVKPIVSLKIPNSLASMIHQGIQSLYDRSSLQKELTPIMRHRVRCKDIKIEKLALNPQGLQLWNQAQSGGYVQDLLGSLVKVNDNWGLLVYFLMLGIIQTKQRRHERGAKDRSIEKQQREEENIPEPTSETYLKLKAYFETISALEAHQLLELEKPGDVNSANIIEKVGVLSATYHPDRYVAEEGGTQKIAERIFQIIQEAGMILDSEEIKAELKLRLDAESRGLQYVSEADTNKADMVYTQGKILYRKKNFDQAYEVVEKAYKLNPYNWRICHMRINVMLKLNKMEKIDAANQLLELQPDQGHEKLEIRFEASELLIQAGTTESKREGYELLDKVLEVDKEHAGAKRLKRLKKKERASKKNQNKPTEEQTEKKGFFSSFFGRK
jgi:tetratricopeptide (TPR) repeat protein